MLATQHISKTNLKSQFKEIRNYSEEQCQPLSIDDYIPQPVVYISPPKWHLAHTTWFFEEFILKAHYDNYREFDKDYSFLFNSYYNTVGDRILRTDRGNLTRPPVNKIYEYRKYVDDHILELLDHKAENIENLLVLGMNHEQQHQELFLTDFKYILGHNPLFPVYHKQKDLTKAKNNQTGFLKMDEGKYNIGFYGDGFCYDNELARHQIFLHEFEISRELTTNGEYKEFIADGGYAKFNLWLDEGWAWVQSEDAQAPKYWHKINDQWHQYTLAGLKPVDPDEILCHINYYEASAFAEWKNMRLPTEFEWEAASEYLDWGNRWEWTASAYLPYPGFAKPDGAVGEYNGKFMVNQMVLRGASAATSPEHSRATYRNFFHPHYRWQFTGIRLAKKQII
jgi:ergothioneine biosynthesis protein EgtB